MKPNKQMREWEKWRTAPSWTGILGGIMDTLVVCAAHRYEDGLIICSPRHYDSVFHACRKAAGRSGATHGHPEQGFVDQRGNFLTREEARAIAVGREQIRRRCGGDEKRLFSENLY